MKPAPPNNPNHQQAQGRREPDATFDVQPASGHRYLILTRHDVNGSKSLWLDRRAAQEVVMLINRELPRML